MLKHQVALPKECGCCEFLVGRISKLERSYTIDEVMDLWAEFVDFLSQSREGLKCLICWLREISARAKAWRKKQVDELLEAGEIYRATRAIITSAGGIGARTFLQELKDLVLGSATA